jgi:hypothetical protein
MFHLRYNIACQSCDYVFVSFTTLCLSPSSWFLTARLSYRHGPWNIYLNGWELIHCILIGLSFYTLQTHSIKTKEYFILYAFKAKYFLPDFHSQSFDSSSIWFLKDYLDCLGIVGVILKGSGYNPISVQASAFFVGTAPFHILTFGIFPSIWT